MKEIAVYFLFTFSFKIYSEQRQLLFSRVEKEEINSSSVVFNQDTNTILYCSVKCSSDTFCVGFGFNTNSKHCFELNDFEREGYFYQLVPTMSDEIFWYRSGNIYFNTHFNRL